MMSAFSSRSPPRRSAIVARGTRSPPGRMRARPDDALADLGGPAVAGRRDLVQAVGAVHHEGADRPELGEHARQGLDERAAVDADHLRVGARGIGQGAEDVERPCGCPSPGAPA